MKIEKKLILCSILAITIGIATIVPLSFLMTPTKAQTTNIDDQPQFNIDVPYAYVTDYWNDSTEANNTWGVVYAIALHGTPNFDLKASNASASVEYYKIGIASEKGSIANLTYSIHVQTDESKPLNFSFSDQNQWFNSSEINGASGTSGYDNGTTMGTITGSGSNWDWSLGEPQTLTVTVQRLGWVIVNNDNSTSIHIANPEVIVQIQLERYGAGFMYNTLFSQDELSQINPLYPETKIIQMS